MAAYRMETRDSRTARKNSLSPPQNCKYWYFSSDLRTAVTRNPFTVCAWSDACCFEVCGPVLESQTGRSVEGQRAFAAPITSSAHRTSRVAVVERTLA